MKLWKDVLSGDEMVSDSYPHEVAMNDCCLKVYSRFVTKGGEDFGIANNDEDEGGVMEEAKGVTVIDVVDGMRLEEMTLDKKTFMTYIKGYLGRVVENLKSKGKEERIPEFKKGSVELTKFIIANFGDLQFFVGPSNDWDGSIGYALQED